MPRSIAAQLEILAQELKGAYIVYMDEILARRSDKRTTGSFLSKDERLKFYEHNMYYALTTTDKYVWAYCETMNWWIEKPAGERNVSAKGGRPDGLEEAIISAKNKYESGLPLGFSIDDMIQRARKERQVNY